MDTVLETGFQMLFGTLVLALWIAPVVLGIRIAREKNRSPHWMWFGLHPVTGWIAYFVLRAQPGLKECPNCRETVKEHARVCAYCMTPF